MISKRRRKSRQAGSSWSIPCSQLLPRLEVCPVFILVFLTIFCPGFSLRTRRCCLLFFLGSYHPSICRASTTLLTCLLSLCILVCMCACSCVAALLISVALYPSANPYR